MKIAHYISSSGVASRREAERLILEGKISLNGRCPVLADRVNEIDIVEYLGKLVSPTEHARLWLYYKSRGLIVSHDDELGRENIFDHVKDKLHKQYAQQKIQQKTKQNNGQQHAQQHIQQKVPNHLISVGRLDLDSEGLMLITTSGRLARHFEDPSNKFKRVYKVRAGGRCNFDAMIRMTSKDFNIDGVWYKSIEIQIEDPDFYDDPRMNLWYTVTLYEGKNREIRKVFEYFGLQVNRLIRIMYGDYKLLDLDVGEIFEVLPPKI